MCAWRPVFHVVVFSQPQDLERQPDPTEGNQVKREGGKKGKERREKETNPIKTTSRRTL